MAASCSDSLDWAFTDTLLAERGGHHWCFRSTLHNQIDLEEQTELKLAAAEIFPANAYYSGKNCDGRKNQERATVREQFGDAPSSPFEFVLGAAIVQKYFQALKRQSQLTNRNSIKHNGRESKLGTLRGFPLATAG